MQKELDNPTKDIGLVLSGGGARGAYQAGILLGIAERLKHDFPFRVITGVSAGAINASALASHQGNFQASAEELATSWQNLDLEEVFKTSMGSLSWSLLRWLWLLTSGGMGLGVRGLFNTKPLHHYLNRAIDFQGIQTNIEAGRLRALALSTTCYRTGKTTTFVQGEPGLQPWERARREAVFDTIGIEHVMASAALPLLFPAIQIGQSYYGDGSIRHPSPLAPAVHLGACRLLTISLRFHEYRSEEPPIAVYPTPAKILGLMMHGVFLDSLENDVERLKRINRTLAELPKDSYILKKMRHIETLILRPSRDLGALANGLQSQLPRTIRLFTKGLGSSKDTSLDFLSYILFVREYTDRLLELGYEDAKEQWDTIEAFVAPVL